MRWSLARPLNNLILSLDVDTGATLSGWTVNVNAKARYNVLAFISAIQNQRGALALVNALSFTQAAALTS
jgi:hypothetical protein